MPLLIHFISCLPTTCSSFLPTTCSSCLPTTCSSRLPTICSGTSFGPFNFSEIPSVNTYSILNMYNNDKTGPQSSVSSDESRVDDSHVLGTESTSSAPNGNAYFIIKLIIRCLKAVLKVLFYVYSFLKYIILGMKNVVCDAVRNRQIDESEGRFKKVLVSIVRSIITSKLFFVFVIATSFVCLYFMFLSV